MLCSVTANVRVEAARAGASTGSRRLTGDPTRGRHSAETAGGCSRDHRAWAAEPAPAEPARRTEPETHQRPEQQAPGQVGLLGCMHRSGRERRTGDGLKANDGVAERPRRWLTKGC